MNAQKTYTPAIKAHNARTSEDRIDASVLPECSFTVTPVMISMSVSQELICAPQLSTASILLHIKISKESAISAYLKEKVENNSQRQWRLPSSKQA